MKATEILMEEHQVILRVIAALEKASQKLENGPMRAGFFLDAADFIQGFADGCHHKKEEGVLFVAMIAHGVPDRGGPIGVMMSEHEQGRAFTRGMREAAQKLEAGDGSARGAVLVDARGYDTLLRQHIYKEDSFLFPMAERVFPPETQAEVAADFERIENEETGAGIHEKYLALAERLEKEVVI